MQVGGPKRDSSDTTPCAEVIKWPCIIQFKMGHLARNSQRFKQAANSKQVLRTRTYVRISMNREEKVWRMFTCLH